MSYNTKNYTEQGGEKTVIGGTLEIKEGASVTGLAANPLLVATEETLGGVKAAAAVIVTPSMSRLAKMASYMCQHLLWQQLKLRWSNS